MLLFGGAIGKERLNDLHWLGPAAGDPSRLEWSRAVAAGPQLPSGSIPQALIPSAMRHGPGPARVSALAAHDMRHSPGVRPHASPVLLHTLLWHVALGSPSTGACCHISAVKLLLLSFRAYCAMRARANSTAGICRDRLKHCAQHRLCPAACSNGPGAHLPQLLPTVAHERAVRAAFSLDVVAGMLYPAGGYGGRNLGLVGDMWALPLPADASQARRMPEP